MASNFEKYAQEGNLFIKKVADELGIPHDIDHAFRVTQAVLHTLRDRITIEESQHLISQLPMAIKAVYVHDWKLGKKREKYETRQEFLNSIYEHGGRTVGRDFDDEPQAKIQAVFRVIKNYVSEDEIAHVKNQLPQEIAELLEV